MKRPHIVFRSGKEVPPETDSLIYGWLYDALMNIITEPPRDMPSEQDILRHKAPMNPNKTGIHGHRLYCRYGLLACNKHLQWKEKEIERFNLLKRYKSPLQLMWDCERAFSATWFALAEHYAHRQRRDAPRWNFAKYAYTQDDTGARDYVKEKQKLTQKLQESTDELKNCIERIQEYIKYNEEHLHD